MFDEKHAVAPIWSLRINEPDANVDPAFVVDAENDANVPAPKAEPVNETSRIAKRSLRTVLTGLRIRYNALGQNPQSGPFVVGSAARAVTSHLKQSTQHERARRSLRA